MDATIEKRFILKGQVINKTPMLIGGGDVDKTRDVAFVKDYEGNPYLPGTSLAGSLKKHFQERYENFNDALDYLWGTEEKRSNNSKDRKQKQSYQAHFIIDDARIQCKNYKITIRDGVKIDDEVGRAFDNALYNYEVLEPGAKFEFSAEITVRKGFGEISERFLNTFKDELENNAFQLGALSSFGFGQLYLSELEILKFPTVNDWLNSLSGNFNKKPYKWSGNNADKLTLETSPYLDIKIELKQTSAFISRDYSQELTEELDQNIEGIDRDSEDNSPDSITLLSRDHQPILTGKTLKGAMRAQAATIINTIKGLEGETNVAERNPDKLLDTLFGRWINDEEKGKNIEKSKSLLQVYETAISSVENLQVHQRVKIDRFTGGTMDSALFNSVPVYPDSQDNGLTVKMRLEDSKTDTDQPSEEAQAYLGLLFYILRDMDDKLFSVGGEKAIGRGLFDVESIRVQRGKNNIVDLNFGKLRERYDDLKPWIEAFHNKIEKN